MFRSPPEHFPIPVQIEDGRCSDENGRCLGEYDGCSGDGCKMYNWKMYIFWWTTEDVVHVKDERFSHRGCMMFRWTMGVVRWRIDTEKYAQL